MLRLLWFIFTGSWYPFLLPIKITQKQKCTLNPNIGCHANQSKFCLDGRCRKYCSETYSCNCEKTDDFILNSLLDKCIGNNKQEIRK